MPVRARRGPPIDERPFHAWLARHLTAGHSGLLPLGDDAAALRVPRNRVPVLTTDALVEGVHFLPGSPPTRVGSAATAVSLSDLAAKGATPRALLLALIVPPGTPRSWARSVVEGAERMAARHGAHVVGGDTKPGAVPAVVSFAVGWADPGRLAPRTGARPGDLLVTTGEVGRGGLAAERLGSTRGPRSASLAGLLDVRPRVAAGLALARWAHAMLDTSDGIAEAARLLARSSRVRVEVEESRLPWAAGLARQAPARRRLLGFFGGDYELLAALAPRDVPPAQRAVVRAGDRLTVVGRVARGHDAWLITGAGARPMPTPGWRPFARRPVTVR